MTSGSNIRRRLALLAAACAATALMAACGGGDDAPTASGGAPGTGAPGTPGTDTPDMPTQPALSALEACNALNGASLPASALTLASGGATVTAATLIAADATGNTLGEYCQVRGTIAPWTLPRPTSTSR
ncbi:hypothetical protein [Cupriavidus campinensis]|uniref:hypothetical protein n=1 Tax=Cupriavidus campinensis TaxID=151783 RepID=UPI00292A472A|nr:hypothetical protein [Cupriavidus campinensis]